MSRTVIGAFLLIALLLGGLLVQQEMDAIHRPIAQMLEVSAESAWNEDWELVDALSAGAEKSWRSSWTFTAAFADHDPMEEVDSLFAQLTVYALARDSQEYAAVCRELARRIDAMADAHTLSWWNLL